MSTETSPAAAAAAETDTDTQTRVAPAASKHAAEEKEASSSSSTSSEDIDEDDFFQIEGPLLGTQFSLGAPAEGSSPHTGQSHAGAGSDTKQPPAPPVQATMSRAPDECPDPKRIPSSVFARSKSTTPTEWSVTSNESLFSINVGNASFSKDHLFLYGKSGELGNLNDPLAPLPPLPRQSPGSSPIRGEVTQKITGQASGKVKKGGPGDGEENSDYIHSLSHRSDGSTTSFAFPILAGDVKSSESLKDNHSEFARQSTAQMTELEQEEPHAEKKETPKPAMEAPKPVEPPVPTPAPVPAAMAPPPPPSATTKWFPWCSCCPICC